MQLIKATEWRRRFFSEQGRPSETWLSKQLRLGEIPGRKIGGCWFVCVQDGSLEPDSGNLPAASNDAEAAANAILEDWISGTETP